MPGSGTHHQSEYMMYKKVFSQQPIVQLLPLKKIREACNFLHRCTSSMRDKMRKKNPENHIVWILKEFICKLSWKISIWWTTKVHLNTVLHTLCWRWQRSNLLCKFSHTVAGILAHTSMQISSRAVMFWGCFWATRTFNSLQRFSMGLRSEDWLGHSRTLKCFLWSHFFITWVVCLRSLPCWNTQPHFIFTARMEMDWGFHSKSHNTWLHSFFLLHGPVVLVPLQKTSPKAWYFHPHASQ